MKKPDNMLTVVVSVLSLVGYFYVFCLCLWGKPLYDETGNVGYIIAFHILSIINYFILDTVVNKFSLSIFRNRVELFFLLHGSLISVFPYEGYLLGGMILMSASLVTAGIRK
jgi:hypothetical protein